MAPYSCDKCLNSLMIISHKTFPPFNFLKRLVWSYLVSGEDTGPCCLDLIMVVSNNLGELYLTMRDHKRHEKWMKILLSTIMIFSDTRKEEEDVQTEIAATSGRGRSQRGISSLLGLFLHNASFLIFRGKCASAA